MPKRMGPAESATVTVAVVGVAAGWVGELSASEMVTGLWAAAMAQREIRKKDMVKAGKQSKAEKRIVQRTPEEINRAILCLGESTSSLSIRKALLSQSYFPKTGRSQWMDATLAWSLLAGVSKPKVFRGR
jgi:hypothetical protein